MREIPLNRGMVTMVDDQDFPWASRHSWYAKEGRNGSFYAQRGMRITQPDGTVRKSTRQLQRDLLDPTMIAPRSSLVDHRDHDTLNNQRYNLRWSTYSESNAHRRMFHGISGFKGVYLNEEGTKYISRIKSGGRFYFGKQQADAASAAGEYNRLAIELFGEFAVLNVIPGLT
jgi:hypothetical protein